MQGKGKRGRGPTFRRVMGSPGNDVLWGKLGRKGELPRKRVLSRE